MTPPPFPQPLAPDQGLIIIGCSRRKLVTSAPVPALELYQGACIPQLRTQFTAASAYRSRIRILSAQHGLLRPDDRITTYERRLASCADALRLQERVSAQLEADLATTPCPTRVLVIAEPQYLLALRHLFNILDRLRLAYLPDPRAWDEVLAVLRRWGWA